MPMGASLYDIDGIDAVYSDAMHGVYAVGNLSIDAFERVIEGYRQNASWV